MQGDLPAGCDPDPIAQTEVIQEADVADPAPIPALVQVCVSGHIETQSGLTAREARLGSGLEMYAERGGQDDGTACDAAAVESEIAADDTDWKTDGLVERWRGRTDAIAAGQSETTALR